MELISFETAQLAKEKGFSIGCDWQYDECGYIGDSLCMPHYFKAPFQYQLLDWLRERHKLHIEIGYDDLRWYYIIYKPEVDENYNVNIFKNFAGINNYNNCLERALQEALKLI